MEAMCPSRMRGVVVRAAAEVALALRVAADCRLPGPLPLVSPPGAAAWLSPPLFLAQITAGQAEAGPAAPEALAVLDCGAAPGHALAALRASVPAVVLDPDLPSFPVLLSAAREVGAALWPAAPPALGLGARRAEHPASADRLRRWLVEGAAGDRAERLG